MARKKAARKPKSVEAITHKDSKRKNIPSAEHQAMVPEEIQSPIQVAYERRNKDLDPQLVWRGKDMLDWSDLVVNAPPLYVQEKIHPKALIDNLRRESERNPEPATQLDLFSDFNGLPQDATSTEFYEHEGRWTNRMILGDSLQVMASLAEREGLRGKVQCIYIDPPYGIKFNSNFQWSTTSRDVKDGKSDHITREPEQVKAFRDTWRDGIHSYLTYLRDRLTVARDLLSLSGSIFVQIGDENVHRVRALLDEVFGEENFASQITVSKTSGLGATLLAGTQDYILWYGKQKSEIKFRPLYTDKLERASVDSHYKEDSEGELYTLSDLSGQNSNVPSCHYTFSFEGDNYDTPRGRQWKTTLEGIERLAKAGRIRKSGKSIRYVRRVSDMAGLPVTDNWDDIGGSVQSRNDPKIYVVQTGAGVVQRCLLMASDPGDLVIDPTSGSGTTAVVAEMWGRRWIAIDTSRVALVLARSRVMAARFPYFVLADSEAGDRLLLDEDVVVNRLDETRKNIRLGFIYSRIARITLQSFSKNAEIDVVWDKYESGLELVREEFSKVTQRRWKDWEIPFEAKEGWSDKAKKLHAEWRMLLTQRQQEIDASIAAKADFEYLYDRPREDDSKVRVAGPFTVESISPHRSLELDENDVPIEHSMAAEGTAVYGEASTEQQFTEVILDNLRVAGVQQANKDGKIEFSNLTPWPGRLICAEGRYVEAEDQPEKKAGIFIGPEFGTVSRVDLVEAAREASEAGFDVLVACAFNFEARTTDFAKLGKVTILKARMNADLHMAEDLKKTNKANLFVVFGEPDIEIEDVEGGQVRVRVLGVDVFNPTTGEVQSDGPEGIACWFVDTNYNQESFFVRHAYFLGANDPYKSLKTTLKAEINREAWETLNSDVSRPFDKPSTGRIAVKVINHLGDEVMKVFTVQ